MSEKKRTRINNLSESEGETDDLDQQNPKVVKFSEVEKSQENSPDSELSGLSAEIASESVDSVVELEEKIEQLEKEVKANYDRFLRVSADFDNYKKRTSREVCDLRKYANEVLLKDLLSVMDNLDRAIETGAKTDTDKNALLEGVQMTRKEVLRVLEKHGVQPFESEGEPFDPSYHEAMMQEETGSYAENTISNELQKGYMIHDRLLRPAMVVVAKAPSNVENNNEDFE